MRQVLFTFFSILILAGAVFAQNISDADRRGFDDLTPILIDVDGDGKPDTITPRVYRVTVQSAVTGTRMVECEIQNWIAFDLQTSRGKKIKSFFKYNYGSTEANYWVYALKSAGDVNGDGKTDLIFYTGDDTSDETVWLANKGNSFAEMRRKISDNSEW